MRKLVFRLTNNLRKKHRKIKICANKAKKKKLQKLRIKILFLMECELYTKDSKVDDMFKKEEVIVK